MDNGGFSTSTWHAETVPQHGPQRPSGISYPGWFSGFPADRPVRKPSPHTINACCQNFEAIAILLADSADAVVDVRTDELCTGALRPAFATYADAHSAASIRSCWST